MSHWQGAVTLLRLEGRRGWIGLLLTMASFAYLGVFMIIPLLHAMSDPGEEQSYSWAVDFLYLTLMPIMGFLMNRNTLNCWNRDPYTRRLAYYRTLPISWNTIVVSRMLQHAIVLTIVFAFYFTLQYLLSGFMREQLAVGDYVLFVLIWYGYALMAGATYIFFELTLKGNAYIIVCFLYVIVYALIDLILWATHTNLIESTIAAAREHHYAWPVLSVVLGAALAVLLGALTRMRVVKRGLLQ
ncbi:hypothetical protein GXP70_06370 [Paenibacillus lycopersici]|uniref:ABC transporter permease n=1 Tax=Paenibacillus lycopersici TaxID=2704462 RepID=A0A6C0FVZ3_9BACL|nr:hypothetical protein [Paenibacillus lycopersici]QHT59613.1 hypothetical protein GXP70_06370 [Paenibacillus lycopersici]